MSKRRLDPRRIVLGLTARACDECGQVQHVWFKTKEEYEEWSCPECRDKLESEDS